MVYNAYECPRRSVLGYRLLCIRSSQKAEQDSQSRRVRLERAYARAEALQAGKRGGLATHQEALQAGQRIVEQEQVQRWLAVEVEGEMSEEYKQVGRGRPGPKTEYQRIENWVYKVRLVEDVEALKREAFCDGLFPLMTNEEDLSLAEALTKYKYQPFVEKRHEQLKSVFAVTPVWLKNVGRVASLLWLYFVVELVQALLEREVRKRMQEQEVESLALYPEKRHSAAPTAALVFNALEGHRRHRLLDEHGHELRSFHDELPEAAQEVLALLDFDTTPYGSA
jgi:transposase